MYNKIMQQCKKCKQTKDAKDFYPGNKSFCKKCLIERSLAWAKDHVEKIKIYNARAVAKPGYRERQTIYYRRWYAEGGKERSRHYSAIVREWQKLNPEKCEAYHLVAMAVKTGKLKKPKRCTRCNAVRRLLGHHEDYRFPLRVEWMCYSCHKKIVH